MELHGAILCEIFCITVELRGGAPQLCKKIRRIAPWSSTELRGAPRRAVELHGAILRNFPQIVHRPAGTFFLRPDEIYFWAGIFSRPAGICLSEFRPGRNFSGWVDTFAVHGRDFRPGRIQHPSPVLINHPTRFLARFRARFRQNDS